MRTLELLAVACCRSAMRGAVACALALVFARGVSAQEDDRALFDALADPEVGPYEISGAGFVTVSSHPMHPGDFSRAEIAVRLMMDPELGEAIIDVVSGEGDEKETDRYFVRRGRIFQIEAAAAGASDGAAADTAGVTQAPREIPANNLGDLFPATVAALHPAIVASAMLERRDNVRTSSDPGAHLFAWNDVLWRVTRDEASGLVQRLVRRTYDERLGDGEEEVRYEGWVADGERLLPGSVVVSARGRELARIEFGPIEHRTPQLVTLADSAGPVLSSPVDGWPAFAVVDDEADRDARVIAERELALREIAPHIFTIDVASMNTRVTVVEFADHLAIVEGVYSSRNCDRIARFVREHFAKPVRWFWFSHLHGQYIGGVRSWIHEGATVLAPPTTAPLIEEMAAAPHTMLPDALELAREDSDDDVRVETIAKSRRLADAMNAVEIYNNLESEHTDEYLLTYFPGPKILLTGDLLFYRPGKPLSGRTKKLCEVVAKLGLDVDTYVCTWPLDGFGTKNIVSAADMERALGQKTAE
jgi:glyoxylase-like metal-dependent hydrolase (beta-lactamase superfamily II)